ncbi:CMRF35-like molecule 8 isoform X2 [Myxocyprinus asiaticus]|uniref:CMRF35-like molecule 8 isoform X2 n=1 Tax=Myxocyprinus asiaticus TaxID=70543 RepID=UPI00222285EF|nr:CMRF35-like molecule 8 isoform X2 [Myxocyprinus asiaticus]
MIGKFLIIFILYSVLCDTLCELSVTGYVGQTANIDCTYAQENTFYPKYFFKISPGRNIKSIYTLKGRKFLRDGRVSMHDYYQRKVFQVTIDTLTENDVGLYACAVGKGHSVETFVLVKLSVMTASQPQEKTVRPSVECTDRSHSNMTTGLFTSTLSAVTEMSKEYKQSTASSDWMRIPLIVVISVLIVTLLAFGLTLFFCQKNRRGSEVSALQNTRYRKSANTRTDNYEIGQKTENVYNQSDSSKCQNSIYQTLHLNQPDPIYQCLNIKTNRRN